MSQLLMLIVVMVVANLASIVTEARNRRLSRELSREKLLRQEAERRFNRLQVFSNKEKNE